MTSEQLVERLAWKLNGGWKNYRLEFSSRDWPGILLTEDELRETVTELSRLQAALAAAESEHRKQIADMAERFRAVNIARVIEQTGQNIFELRDRTEAAEAKLASLPALLAETRKKALEEAAAHLKAKAEEMRGTPVGAAMAAIFDEQAAAIRSLSAEEAQ